LKGNFSGIISLVSFGNFHKHIYPFVCWSKKIQIKIKIKAVAEKKKLDGRCNGKAGMAVFPGSLSPKSFVFPSLVSHSLQQVLLHQLESFGCWPTKAAYVTNKIRLSSHGKD